MNNISIGYNITSGEDIIIAEKLLSENSIDYVEFLIDNFLYVDPLELSNIFLGVDSAFHIMNSMYLESDQKYLNNLSLRINKLSEVLSPFYISDHILKFKNNQINLPYLQEIDYQHSDLNKIAKKVIDWSNMLGGSILIENTASLDSRGKYQHVMLNRILKDGNGILFDISNYVLSIKNSKLNESEWKDIISKSQHFHIGGFVYNEVGHPFFIDSHDRTPSLESFYQMKQIFKNKNKNISLTYERDDACTFDNVNNDLLRLKEFLND